MLGKSYSRGFYKLNVICYLLKRPTPILNKTDLPNCYICVNMVEYVMCTQGYLSLIISAQGGHLTLSLASHVHLE